MMNLQRSGGIRYKIDRIIVLMPTDLPEPVVPAISRCGMRARSAMTGSPETACVVLENRHVEQFAEVDGLGLEVRQFDADHGAAGHDRDPHRNGAHRAG